MRNRNSPLVTEWLENFENRYVSVCASVNALRKEAEAQHLSEYSAKKIQHKVETLETCLGLLTAPKPQRRRGPVPKGEQDDG